MTEQKERFMQQLDQWAYRQVIQPIVEGALEDFTGENVPETIDFPEVKKRIREKVFESYREETWREKAEAQTGGLAEKGLPKNTGALFSLFAKTEELGLPNPPKEQRGKEYGG